VAEVPDAAAVQADVVGGQIVPIPGTRRRERLEENAASTQVALSADDVADLNAAAARIGVQGNRYNDLHMGLVDR